MSPCDVSTHACFVLVMLIDKYNFIEHLLCCQYSTERITNKLTLI